jgi:iron complex outermembrane recepter protein
MLFAFVLLASDLAASGKTSLGDVLRDLPIQAGAINTQNNNGGDGSTRVGLRGLGEGYTVVLLNGRRFVPGGTGADETVDLNTIPLAMIERVEVLKTGSSAIYGSGAIGGVINIVTKEELDGFELSTYLGGTKSGGFTYALGATAGSKIGRARLLAGVFWVNESSILAGERTFSSSDFSFDYMTGETFPALSSAIPEGQVRDGTDMGPLAVTYNPNPENYLVTPSRRAHVWAHGDYEIGESTRLFFEAGYNTRASEQRLAPFPLFTVTQGIVVSADNIYNSFGRNLMDVRRRMTEAGNRLFEQDVRSYRALAGVEGSFSSTGHWNVSAGYGRTASTETQRGDLLTGKLRDALGPSFRDAQGTPTCGTPARPIAGCVPLNLFAGAGAIPRDQIESILYTATSRGSTQQWIFDAGAGGELFELWERPVRFYGGFHHRSESGAFVPDAMIEAGLTTGNRFSPFEGTIGESAAFLEVAVPVIAGLPVFELLEVHGALRVAKLDPSGWVSAYAGNMHWQMMEHLALRITLARSFRAPNIFELNDPISGTPGLDPEKGGMFSAGVVLTPKGHPAIESLSISIDAFEAAVGDQILLQPSVDGIDHFINAGSLNTAGVDLAASYAVDTDGGTIGARLDAVVLSRFDHATPQRTTHGKGVFDLNAAYPSLRFSTAFSYAVGGFVAGVAGRYIGSFTECEINDCSQEARDAFQSMAAGDPSLGAFPERSVAASFTTDLYAGYTFDTDYGSPSIRAGINNVFDAEPPLIENGFTVSSDPSIYDFRGRYFYLGLQYNY